MALGKPFLSRLAAATLVLALGCLCIELLAGPSYRLEWLTLKQSLTALRWAAMLAAAVSVLALLLGGLAGRRLANAGRWQCRAAVLIALMAFVPPAYLWTRVDRLPRIHDISTDTLDPPVFVAIAPLRKNAPNTLDYSQAVAQLQKQGFPDIGPAVLQMPPQQAFARAKAAAQDMGWELVALEPDQLRIEATATTLLFGFKDDVVIRIRSEQGSQMGSRVDVRSVSRVGGSDFGTNANRVRAFLKKLR
jgi:uncharacterized protein (DUF1499 family)